MNLAAINGWWMLTFAMAGIYTVMFSWLIGAIIFVFEALGWLRLGQWPIKTMAVAVAALPTPVIEWLVAPTAWFGLHKIAWALVEAPLSAVVAALGTLAGLLVGSLSLLASVDEQPEKEKEEEKRARAQEEAEGGLRRLRDQAEEWMRNNPDRDPLSGEIKPPPLSTRAGPKR